MGEYPHNPVSSSLSSAIARAAKARGAIARAVKARGLTVHDTADERLHVLVHRRLRAVAGEHLVKPATGASYASLADLRQASQDKQRKPGARPLAAATPIPRS